MCGSGRACTKAIRRAARPPVSGREGRQHVHLWRDPHVLLGPGDPLAEGRGGCGGWGARYVQGAGLCGFWTRAVLPGAYFVIPQWGHWIGAGFQNACLILKKRKVLRCSNSFFSDAESKPGTIWICRSPEITGHVWNIHDMSTAPVKHGIRNGRISPTAEPLLFLEKPQKIIFSI